ncbi:hypothetical protein D3C73_1041790 [compost metagenome]
MQDTVHGIGGVVHQLDQVEVLLGHHAFCHQGVPDPLKHGSPEPNTEQHDGERGHLAGLDKHHCLEQLIQGAKPSGEHYEALRVLDEHGLAGEEVPEVDAQVHPLVESLLKWQFNAQAH